MKYSPLDITGSGHGSHHHSFQRLRRRRRQGVYMVGALVGLGLLRALFSGGTWSTALHLWIHYWSGPGRYLLVTMFAHILPYCRFQRTQVVKVPVTTNIMTVH